MKKIVALFLCFTMCLFAGTAFADELDFIVNSSKNCTYSTDISIKLDKPLEILTVLEDNGVFGSLDNYVDLRGMVEGMFASTSHADVKINLSDDYKKIRMAVTTDSSMPIKVNKNFKADLSMQTGIWIDFDLTEDGNPKLDYIISYPIMNKYLHITTDDLKNEEGYDQFTAMFKDGNIFADAMESSVKYMKKYGKITMSGDTCTIKFSDEDMKNYLCDLLQEIMGKMSAPDSQQTDFAALKESLKYTTIFGEKGVVIVYKLDKDKNISSATAEYSIDLNVYDIMIAMGEIPPEYITKENSCVAFSMSENTSFSDVGKTDKIDFPALTEDNSVTLQELYPYYYNGDYDDGSDYQPQPSEWVSVYMGELVIDDGIIYVPMRDVLDDYLYEFENGYTLTCENGVLRLTSEALGIDELAIVTATGDVWRNGQKYLYKPVKNICGVNFVDSRIIEDFLGLKLDSAWNDYIQHSAGVEFHKYN